MSGKENEQELSARKLKKRAAAAESRAAKRERMGEQAYLRGEARGAAGADEAAEGQACHCSRCRKGPLDSMVVSTRSVMMR